MMVKNRATLKRLSTASQSTLTQGVDVKARRRIEDLFELTDEIINAYNEINAKYVQQIYRKYQQLKEKHAKLQEQLAAHHCAGCQCDRTAVNDQNETEIDEGLQTPATSTSSIVLRSKATNPFIISDIDESQNLNPTARRARKTFDDDDDDDDDENDGEGEVKGENGRQSQVKKRRNDGDDDEEEEDEKNENDEDSLDEAEAEEDADSDSTNEKGAGGYKKEPNADDDGIGRLPLALRTIIQRKVEKSRRAKAYLLKLPRFPGLCEYLLDRSRRSFDLRPNEDLVRPFAVKHVNPHSTTDGKLRQRIRDELREIHRSYLRTFMNDPHSVGGSGKKPTAKLPLKKSPL